MEIDLTVTPLDLGVRELHDPIYKGRPGEDAKIFYYIEVNDLKKEYLKFIRDFHNSQRDC